MDQFPPPDVSGIRVVGRRRVEPDGWDHALEGLDGPFFHCHGNAVFAGSGPNLSPCFLEAFQGSELLGMAAAAILTPRWPLFSRFCKEAVILALPATRTGGAGRERMILAAFEKSLKAMGVFKVRVQGDASRNSAEVLSSLGYATTERYDFSIDLSPGVDALRASLPRKRRGKLRKAMANGLTVEPREDLDGVVEFLELHDDAMRRKGVGVSNRLARSERVHRLLIASGRTTLLVCSQGGNRVGAIIFGRFGRGAHLLHSGSSLEGNRLNAPVLLIWRMIEMLVEQGVESAGLGGVTIAPGHDAGTDGLYRFKRDFGIEPVLQPSGVKVLSRPGAAGDAVRTGGKRIIRRALAGGRRAPGTAPEGPAGAEATRISRPVSE